MSVQVRRKPCNPRFPPHRRRPKRLPLQRDRSVRQSMVSCAMAGTARQRHRPYPPLRVRRFRHWLLNKIWSKGLYNAARKTFRTMGRRCVTACDYSSALFELVDAKRLVDIARAHLSKERARRGRWHHWHSRSCCMLEMWQESGGAVFATACIRMSRERKV